TPTGCSPGCSSSTGSGAPTTWATRRPWTFTSSGCAPRSRPTRPSPGTSSRCGALATSSSRQADLAYRRGTMEGPFGLYIRTALPASAPPSYRVGVAVGVAGVLVGLPDGVVAAGVGVAGGGVGAVGVGVAACEYVE